MINSPSTSRLPTSLYKSVGSQLRMISHQFDHHDPTSSADNSPRLSTMQEIGADLRQLSLAFDQRMTARKDQQEESDYHGLLPVYPQRQRHPAGPTASLALDPSPSFFCKMETVSLDDTPTKSQPLALSKYVRKACSKENLVAACTLLSVISCLVLLQNLLFLIRYI